MGACRRAAGDSSVLCCQSNDADHMQPATAGLMVTQRNWLDVYPYTHWGGNVDLPVFAEGQRFMPSQLLLSQVHRVCCPPLLCF